MTEAPATRYSRRDVHRRGPPHAIGVITPLTHIFSMSSALHTVAETLQYLKDCAAVGMTEEERKAIVDNVAADPR